MVRCRLQVLAQCNHVNAMYPQVLQYLLNLLKCFTKTQHDARLGGDVRMLCLEAFQQLQRPFVISARPDIRVQRLDGFQVVIEYVRRRGF